MEEKSEIVMQPPGHLDYGCWTIWHHEPGKEIPDCIAQFNYELFKSPLDKNQKNEHYIVIQSNPLEEVGSQFPSSIVGIVDYERGEDSVKKLTKKIARNFGKQESRSRKIPFREVTLKELLATFPRDQIKEYRGSRTIT